MTTKQKPEHTVRLGRVKAAIWANRGAKGGVHFNVTLSRFYKVNGSWRESSSFGRDELLLACKVLNQAHTWVLTHPHGSTE